MGIKQKSGLPDDGESAKPAASTDTVEPEVVEPEVVDPHIVDPDAVESKPSKVRSPQSRSSQSQSLETLGLGEDALAADIPSAELDEVDEVDDVDADDADGPVRSRATVPAVRDLDPAQVDDSHKALVRTDPLSLYLAEIRQYPILSREEEHELAVRYAEEDDPDAAVQLVTANLRLVVMVAREYQRAFHNLLDLVQEGNVGLLEAVKQFDPYRGVRFPSYAVWWIRAYVIRYVMNNFRMVKVGTTQAQRRLFFNLRKEKSRLEAEGFKPSARRIAENLGVKEREVLEMDQRMSAGSEVSGSAPLGGDGTGTVMDMLPDSRTSTEDTVADGEFYSIMKEKLDAFGATLEGRESEIFAERLVAEDPLTLQELGDRYGVSRERVRQMEAALKKRLREFLVSEVKDLDGEAG